MLLALVLLASLGPSSKTLISSPIPSSKTSLSSSITSSTPSTSTLYQPILDNKNNNNSNNNITKSSYNNGMNTTNSLNQIEKVIFVNQTKNNNLMNITDIDNLIYNNADMSKSSLKYKSIMRKNHIGFLSVYLYIFIVLFFLYAIIIVAIRLRMRSNILQGSRRDENSRRMQIMLHLLRSRGGMSAAISGLRDLPAIVRLAMTNRDFTGDDYELLSQLDDPRFNNTRGVTEAQLNRFPMHTITYAELNNMNYDNSNNISGSSNSDITIRRTSSRNNITDDNNKRNCSICLAPYEVGDNVRTIPCLHYFHHQCIDPWLKSNSSCPVCKHSCLERSSEDDE